MPIPLNMVFLKLYVSVYKSKVAFTIIKFWLL